MMTTTDDEPTAEKHPETDRLMYDCSRCEETMNPDGRPIEATDVLYVVASGETNPYMREINIAVRHTDETRAVRSEVMDEYGLSAAEANRVMARRDDVYVPESRDELPEGQDFEFEPDIDPEDVKDDPEVVQVISDEHEVEMDARYLICPDCEEEGDERLWTGLDI